MIDERVAEARRVLGLWQESHARTVEALRMRERGSTEAFNYKQYAQSGADRATKRLWLVSVVTIGAWLLAARGTLVPHPTVVAWLRLGTGAVFAVQGVTAVVWRRHLRAAWVSVGEHRKAVEEAKSDELAASLGLREAEGELRRVVAQAALENQRLVDLERARAAEASQQAAAEAQAEKVRRAQFAERTCFIKRAFTYWQTIGVDPEAYADLHWREILPKERDLEREYEQASALGFTGDGCYELASWSLAEVPREVSFWVPRVEDRTVEHLAYVFRRCTGDWIERILPRARELQRAQDERERRDADRLAALDRQEKRIAREHRLATTYGGRDRARSPLERLANRLPEHERSEAVATVERALTAADRQAFNFEVEQRERRRLEEEGVPPDEIEDRLAALELNLNQGARASARREEMIG